MNTRLSARVILCAALIALGCGSGEDILQQNPPPPSGGNLTDEQRMSVLNEISTFVNSLGDFKSEEAQQTIATYLKARSEFMDAGVQSGNVWATFHDGRMVIIVPTYLNEPAFSGADSGGRINITHGSGRYNAPGGPEGRGKAIPSLNTGILFNGLGTAFWDGRPYLEYMFDHSHAVYALEKKDATIENLKQVDGQAIIYILTHGGMGLTLSQGLRLFKFSLWTSDRYSSAREQQYKNDLDDGSLTYVLGLQNENQGLEWHYGITQEFVKKYMTFADDAFVYVDACSSMSEEAKPFGEQVLDKCKNKMGTFIGWTNQMSSVTYAPTHRYIFDRMIASNDVSGTEQTPPQRPFDFVSVYKDMLTYPEIFNLGVSRAHGGRLAYNSRSNSEVLLTPSISYILMSDYENKLAIHGLFGDGPQEQGEVYINGNPASIELWSRYLIVCNIDQDGDNASGEVIVLFNDHWSNAVPITSWTIPMTVTREVGGIKTEAKLTLKLRGDVHRYRTVPNATPILERPDSLGLFLDEEAWLFSKASSGTYTVSGSRSHGCALVDCQVSETLTSRAEGGNLPYEIAVDGLHFYARYRWSRDLKRLRVGLRVYVPDVELDHSKTYRSCREGANRPDEHDTEYENFVIEAPSDEHEVIEFEFDENFKIAKGDKPEIGNLLWGVCETSISRNVRIEWPEVDAENPPTDKTSARMFNDMDVNP